MHTLHLTKSFCKKITRKLQIISYGRFFCFALLCAVSCLLASTSSYAQALNAPAKATNNASYGNSVETKNAMGSLSLREQNLALALEPIKEKNWEQAQIRVARLQDPLAAQLYHWLVFSQGPENIWKETKFVRLAQFIRDHPHWPSHTSLRRAAEKTMPLSLSEREVVTWFNDYSPQTPQGIERYLRALLITGNTQKASTYISNLWEKTLVFNREEQKNIFRQFGHLIQKEAHKKRLDKLLYAGHYSNAKAVAGLLDPSYKALANARIALAKQDNQVDALIAKVPPSLQNNQGLLYERLKWRRKKGYNARAIEILQNSPPMQDVGDPSLWWRERHILIRRFLEKGDFQTAYSLAKTHKQISGFSYVQAQWIRYWLALRFQKQPSIALQGFSALYADVKTPISRSRMAYWAGRAAQSLQAQEVAQSWYHRASAHQTTYYGQMAVAELGLENELPNVSPPILSIEEENHMLSSELISITKILHKAGLRKEASKFLQKFAAQENSAKAYKFTADLAAILDHHHDAISLAKQANKKGFFLTKLSYPVLSHYMQNIASEWALLHAIMRQESRFDKEAKSSAGALGLMQLMPATAKEVARKNNIKHTTSWLTSKPQHNITLGASYIDEMLARYTGSYVLAIAAYNAGPGRVDKWIKTFGDPRTHEVNIVDWIELIPIYETRNYVQRVLEGIYVYRLRLQGKQNMPLQSIHIAMPQ